MHAQSVQQAVPTAAAKAKGKGNYLPKDVAGVAMLLLTGLLIAYTGARHMTADSSSRTL